MGAHGSVDGTYGPSESIGDVVGSLERKILPVTWGAVPYGVLYSHILGSRSVIVCSQPQAKVNTRVTNQNFKFLERK